MKRLLMVLAILLLCTSASFAENWWDTPAFNYGVGVASVVAGVCLNNGADAFNKCGADNIAGAQTYADLAGYNYAWGYTASENLDVAISNGYKQVAEDNYNAAENQRAYGYALVANGLWLLTRGVCDSLKPVVSNKKVALEMSVVI